MSRKFDAVIIGSGFGGALAARVLVDAGWSVLLVERGDFVERGPAASSIENFAILSPHYSRDTAYRVLNGGRPMARPLGALFCVGGASVFYGGVSFRFREADFAPPPEITTDSGARWPIGYADLEPFYSEAERILGVAGDAENDPTAPPRSAPYPAAANPFSPLSAWLAESAGRLGLHPFPLPMAINFGQDPQQASCVRCGRCDGWPCPVSAKNDVVTRVIEPLLSTGKLTLLPRAAVTRLVEREGRISAVECLDLASRQPVTVEAAEVLLAAGTLASPQLLLASGLERLNPGGATVGRYLMRHANSVVFGRLNRRFPRDGLGKDLAILDYYGGAAGSDAPPLPGPLGSIQSLPIPPVGVIATQVPWPLPWLAGWFLARAAGLLTIAEDQPQAGNRVILDRAASDGAGLPALTIAHTYSSRDLAASRALRGRARAILRAAGARFFYRHPIQTFSHALGTIRMGPDERTSALDSAGRFRGVANLRVVDGSVFPTSAAVNPSLTIAANSLRVATALVRA